MNLFNRLIRILVLVTGLTSAALCIAAGNTTEKFALVIGNRDYQTRDATLPNAVRDAEMMSKSLQSIGFQVTQHSNLGRSELFKVVTEFTDRLPAGATALVFYAGHGMQIGGNSFLTPVDMEVTGEQSVPIRSYPVKSLLDSLAKGRAAVNIVVLDACRNNPFRPQPAVRYRNFADLGLARVQAPRGTLLAYSTSPGQAAADGRGNNSLYTEVLARRLREPQLELEEVFKLTASEVRKLTLDDQIPWYESSLTERYYFQPPEGVTVTAGKPLRLAQGAARPGGVLRSGTPAQSDLAWYRQLNEHDWNQLDWEIQQRVKRMTPDELPALEHKAAGGNVIAQTTLGLVYREGTEKAADPGSGRTLRFKANNTKAVKWLRQAADNGFPIAQTELGEMYYSGHGLDRNLGESRHWLEQAAAARYPRAKLDLFQLNLETDPQSANVGDAMNAVINSFRIPAQAAPR